MTDYLAAVYTQYSFVSMLTLFHAIVVVIVSSSISYALSIFIFVIGLCV